MSPYLHEDMVLVITCAETGYSTCDLMLNKVLSSASNTIAKSWLHIYLDVRTLYRVMMNLIMQPSMVFLQANGDSF